MDESGIEKRTLDMVSAKILLVIVAFVVVAFVFFTFSGPTLLNLHTGPMGGDAEVVIFNPFRDRAPERSTEEFLKQLKTGKCDKVIGVTPGDEKSHRHVCELEKQFPIVSWRIREIDATKGGRISLSYSLIYENGQGEGRLFIWVEKKNESWVVTEYKRNY